MSKVTKVTYGMTRQTKKGRSSYEYDRIDVEVQLNESDTFDTAKQHAKALCLIGLGRIDNAEVKAARALVALADSTQGMLGGAG